MALDFSTCFFTGPAFPDPFVKFDLEIELRKAKLLPSVTGPDGSVLKDAWEAYRRKLRELVATGGSIRVFTHVIEPLLPLLGYQKAETADAVATRLEPKKGENGGWLLTTDDGQSKLRVWSTSLDEDLDAPAKRGAAYRYSHLRIAQRVLLASGERIGILTNGSQLRILISDPARPDSEITIGLESWRQYRALPDSFLLLLALCRPEGVKALTALVNVARLKQTRVTKELRVQARQAIELFVQEVLDHPANQEKLAAIADRQKLARDLWHEGLVIIYRLLFVLKGEASDDPATGFSFSSTSLWRNTYSPSVALAQYARVVLDDGKETGGLLEGGVRALFRMFCHGLDCTELHVKPLGGALFGEKAAPLLSDLHWGERAVAHLLDRLLWTPRRRGSEARERVHYGPLDVEDLGRVYEALLELEPGIAAEPMCRLRRAKLEVVVPVAQGEKYRPAQPRTDWPDDTDPTDPTDDDDDEDAEPTTRKKTKVEWIDLIQPGRFYLRVGLGRKSSGSYYTPHSFVRFLVQETLHPQIEERSPAAKPNPAAILKLKVLDPAMGSGHFLVEACRFIGEHLYEACRLCDEKASAAEKKAEAARAKGDKDAAENAAKESETWRKQVLDLPDPDDELLRYLPGSAPEGEESGLSQKKALALCRRLVAVHCLYGVDKNPLAVELAKLSLWLESSAEGLPLTFLDHRLVVGDSLTGPFWDRLLTKPSKPAQKEKLEDIFTRGLSNEFMTELAEALEKVRRLEGTVGATVAEVENKQRLKQELDAALLPFKVIAAAWSGGVMLGPEQCDDHAYAMLVKAVCEKHRLPHRIDSDLLRKMIARGLGVDTIPAKSDDLARLIESGGTVPALAYGLTFPEVFYAEGTPWKPAGFDAVLGNPPWDAVRSKAREFFASHDFEILAAPTKRERSTIEKRLLSDEHVAAAHATYEEGFQEQHRIHDIIFRWQVVELTTGKTGGNPDSAKLFLERNAQLLCPSGLTGVVAPSAFHASEGTTGIRRLYLEQMGLRCCYSFENRWKLFEIHSSFKFAVIIASATGPTDKVKCSFYLHDDEVLGQNGTDELAYDLDFIRRTGGEHLTLLELQSRTDLDIAKACFVSGKPFGALCLDSGIDFGREMDMTDDAWRFTPADRVAARDPRDPDVAMSLVREGNLVLYEGKNFWHFDDHWGEPIRYIVEVANIAGKREWMKSFPYFRALQRRVASATNERTVVFCIVPPWAISGNSCFADVEPMKRPDCAMLTLTAKTNSFPFDWCGRQMVAANLSGFIRDRLPLCSCQAEPLLSHAALRLTCNHFGYAALWCEQLGTTWRENKPPFTWPVLATSDERWEVRSAIDAVVADAYGLSREQYEHVLSTFSHKSYPKAPELCLAKFDELKQIGLDAFTKKHDPYWDIPLNEDLPQPDPEVSAAIENALKAANDGREAKVDLFGNPVPTDLFGNETPPKPRRRKK